MFAVLYWTIKIYVGFLIFNLTLVAVTSMNDLITNTKLTYGEICVITLMDFIWNMHQSFLDTIHLWLDAAKWGLFAAFGVITIFESVKLILCTAFGIKI
jgi:hypothetical protein